MSAVRGGTLGCVKLPGAWDATSEPKENMAGLETGKIWGVKLGVGEAGLLESSPGAAGMWPELQQAEQGASEATQRTPPMSLLQLLPLF